MRLESRRSRMLQTSYFPSLAKLHVKWLCNKFGLAFSAVKNDYREFKESKGIRIPIELEKKLTYLLDTIPVSTAACERGFSKMNTVCTVLVC